MSMYPKTVVPSKKNTNKKNKPKLIKNKKICKTQDMKCTHFNFNIFNLFNKCV